MKSDILKIQVSTKHFNYSLYCSVEIENITLVPSDSVNSSSESEHSNEQPSLKLSGNTNTNNRT